MCPDRCWLPGTLENRPSAGLAISLYGAHSESTWGTGDFTTLRAIIDWAAEKLECSYIALNPLQAIHNRQPFNTSPYLPNSTIYRNLIYLDIDALPEIRTIRKSDKVLAEIAALNKSEFVEYERVQALKLRLLRCCFRVFRQRDSDTERGEAFRQFCEHEGEQLELYATYCALDARIHRDHPNIWVWSEWPAEFHDPHSEAVKAFQRANPRTILFYQYVQWLIDRQASETQAYARSQGLSIGLFHDLPLATDRCGFELWANRSFYVQGCRVGSPPDDFAPDGQDWGFPPPNTIQHQRDGYRLFADSIRKSAQHGGALRLDHVMRLFRLFWIPDGVETAQGTYVKDNAEELLSVLALESVRSKIVIVGEDLGTVEPEMREMLNRFGVLSYRLFFFERRADGSFKAPGEYPPSALVSSTTHDLPTLAGFWAGQDINLRRSLGVLDDAASDRWKQQRQEEKRNMLAALFDAGLLDPKLDRAIAEGPELTGEIHNAIIGFLAKTPSKLLTINQEDLTKELDQQNLPGTTWEYPNWRRKMKFSVEQLWTEPAADDFATMLRNWLAATGRSRRAER
jgi:4-alpha-glucanotransferase